MEVKSKTEEIEEILKELSGGLIYGNPVSNYKAVAEKIIDLFSIYEATEAKKPEK